MRLFSSKSRPADLGRHLRSAHDRDRNHGFGLIYS